ncbi:hypothetical protein GOBAR_AA25867 [Gossypium barbadense]|uniref:Uncharacterized protein n=1 Tax=Gossypium barbadense TaxID=3634 RepID=A0A2P5WUR4_GOSBA|nr:hypothetical protein GOBAR_AA25867 [Gossypium barbadense]
MLNLFEDPTRRKTFISLECGQDKADMVARQVELVCSNIGCSSCRVTDVHRHVSTCNFEDSGIVLLHWATFIWLMVTTFIFLDCFKSVASPKGVRSSAEGWLLYI